MNKKTFPLLLATAMVLGACSNDTLESGNVEVTDDSQKTKIAFSMTDAGSGLLEKALTRAGVDEFTASTKVVMRIKSNEYGGSGIRYTRTVATANPQGGKKYATISLQDDYRRYWDDAFGRKAQLSVYAIAVPNKNDASLTIDKLTNGGSGKFVNGTQWFTEETENEKVVWTVNQVQTPALLESQDLAYSNNIQDGGVDGVYTYDFENTRYTPILADDASNVSSLADGQMKFQLQDGGNPDGPGKFNQGHLIFNRALTRLTVNIRKGVGVINENAFALQEGISVKGVYNTGTFDIQAGSWTTAGDPAGITSMAKTSNIEGDAQATYCAQFLPSYTFVKDNITNVLKFKIDGCDYQVTQAQIYDALNANAGDGDGKNGLTKDAASFTMEAGKNYVVTITVGKTEVDNVTATLMPWIEITGGEKNINNSHITISTKTMDNDKAKACDHFDLYRLVEETAEITTTDYAGTAYKTGWTTADMCSTYSGATKKLTVNDADAKTWSTPWYFESNKIFYHFRSVNENTSILADSENGDYFAIVSGEQANHDYHWGAPMNNTATLEYNTTTGFASSVYHCIGATEDQINIIEQHMMSNINVILKTVDGSDAVNLGDGSSTTSQVYLTYFYANGKVNMGNGLVSTTGDLAVSQEITSPTTYYKTTNKETNPFTYAVVPQTLKRTSGEHLYIGITIKTPDNNEYYVVKDLSEIEATSVGGSQVHRVDGKIQYWYPGHSYTYTFTLNKTDITAITCTIKDWIDVVGGNQNVTLEAKKGFGFRK